MLAVSNGLENCVLKALDNFDASIQQNEDGLNIGMISATYKMENCVLKALKNDEARKQVNKFNENILKIAQSNRLTSVLETYNEFESMDYSDEACEDVKE